MSKYEPLKRYLDTVRITLTYKEIEEILGTKLPESAYTHGAWWDNTTGNHVQHRAWVDAGWKVVEKKLGEAITFQKYSSI